MLEQYPRGALARVDRQQLQRAIHDHTELAPGAFPFDDRAVRDGISGFEGYEAIVFENDRVYLLIEARSLLGAMRGYLVAGRVGAEGIVLEKRLELPMPVQADNFAFEALVPTREGIAVFYEAPGLMPSPEAYLVARDLSGWRTLAAPPLPYRLTDVAAAPDGSLHALHVYWHGERAKLRQERQNDFGEIVRLRSVPQGFALTGTPLPLHEGDTSYNWEGIAWFEEERGYLVVTDSYPRSLLRFVRAEGE